MSQIDSSTGTDQRTVTIAVIGAGPRGVSFLERLLAQLSRDTLSQRVRIVVCEPHQVGPGRVWSTEQSELLLMNTPSFYPTAAATAGTGLADSGVGLTFDQWRQSTARVNATLHRNDYPPRAVYGAYLRELSDRVRAALENHPAVQDYTIVSENIVEVVEAEHAGYSLATESGRVLQADHVVLALGHGEARLNRNQQQLLDASESVGLNYIPPNLPAEVDYASIPAGADVLIRGMGLNFFDALSQFTQARGGTYVETGRGPGQRFDYVPSGQEPVLHAGSRRGTPYFPKAETDAFVPHGVTLRYLTDANVQRLLDQDEQVDFQRDLWPLIHRDVVRAYYDTLVQEKPETFGAVTTARNFYTHLVTMLEVSDRGEPLTRRHVEDALRDFGLDQQPFDIRSLSQPIADSSFATSEEYQREVHDVLVQLCEHAAAGERSAVMMAIGTLHAARLVVKRLVAEQRVSDPSRLRDIAGWFEPLVEGLASGPPLERIEQLLAVSRAGLVQFIGPAPHFEVAESIDHEGQSRFAAVSPHVGTDANPVAAHLQRRPSQFRHEGTWMLEAMMPANQVQLSENPLLRQLLDSGLARPRPEENDEGAILPGRGLDVTAPRPYRLIRADGTAHRSVYVLGLQLASVQWGTAIAAESGQDPAGRAWTLGDADAAARDILDRLGNQR
ncbi:FAD/NAD(P)-binding protein [Citricoccus muralis]|uniref:FAD/NAD(P)-binding protein n=1 Tax=Citricoccus muralis TaxID=169134 RepID=A0ABY8H7S1_9MICC|nr:FAD/NAD(P)-binding domain-containing protein [Citricoccus muralis]WFP17190.1 FAD/NAD(P)-binding protein [Citricoccus muralis]